MSDSDPIAWAVMLADGDRVYDVYVIEEEAKAIDEAVAGNHGIAPLYRSPALTDAEREAIEWAVATTAQRYDDPIGPIQRERLRGLLARTQ
jgi:mono/diheme cytochrome c family protein